VISPGGESFDFGGFGVQWKIGGPPTGGRFAVVHHPTPAGFENYFREVAAAWGDVARFATINQKYSLEMKSDSVPGLCERFGLTFPQL